MSVKIHEGLRATTSNPFAVARGLRLALEAEYMKRFQELLRIATEVAEKDETVTWGKLFFAPGKLASEPVASSRLLSHSLYEVIRKLDKQREFTFSSAAIGYSVTLMENQAGGNPLVLVFGEQARSYRELLISENLVEPYGYWDNADPEEDATEEEWQERAQAWSELSLHGPSEVGLEFSFPDFVSTHVALMELSR